MPGVERRPKHQAQILVAMFFCNPGKRNPVGRGRRVPTIFPSRDGLVRWHRDSPSAIRVSANLARDVHLTPSHPPAQFYDRAAKGFVSEFLSWFHCKLFQKV